MPQIPDITVQLVHIKGPLKGQIQEFSQFPVHVGRHSTCQIRFGKAMATISRQHARIECQNSRFRIIDVSTNGTYVNGKRIADVYLRDGDVITFAENGPKASFLTKINAGTIPISKPPSVQQPPPPVPEADLTVGPDLEIPMISTDAPLVIQFGPTLQTFDLLPITIGTDPSCDFVIANDALNGQHVQIFFSGGNYYVKDLTETGTVTINGRAAGTQSVLAQGAELSLTDQGPRFRFFGDGRLAEIQDMLSEPLEKSETAATSQVSDSEPPLPKKKKSLLKSIFKRGQ